MSKRRNILEQGETAKKLNTSRQAILAYEEGKRTCSIGMLLKVADLFKVSTDDLLVKNNIENK